MAVLVSLLEVLTTELNLQHLNVKIVSLKLSRGAELNPGPYEIVRSVQFREVSIRVM